MADAMLEKLSWVRNGAGGRFDAIELSLCPTLLLTNDRLAEAERYADQQGWQGISVDDVLAMPSVFIDSAERIVADIRERRDKYGFSYYIIGDKDIHIFAPIVAALNGE